MLLKGGDDLLGFILATGESCTCKWRIVIYWCVIYYNDVNIRLGS